MNALVVERRREQQDWASTLEEGKSSNTCKAKQTGETSIAHEATAKTLRCPAFLFYSLSAGEGRSNGGCAAGMENQGNPGKSGRRGGFQGKQGSFSSGYWRRRWQVLPSGFLFWRSLGRRGSGLRLANQKRGLGLRWPAPRRDHRCNAAKMHDETRNRQQQHEAAFRITNDTPTAPAPTTGY